MRIKVLSGCNVNAPYLMHGPVRCKWALTTLKQNVSVVADKSNGEKKLQIAKMPTFGAATSCIEQNVNRRAFAAVPVTKFKPKL